MLTWICLLVPALRSGQWRSRLTAVEKKYVSRLTGVDLSKTLHEDVYFVEHVPVVAITYSGFPDHPIVESMWMNKEMVLLTDCAKHMRSSYSKLHRREEVDLRRFPVFHEIP